MKTDHIIIIAETNKEFDAGRILFKEYASGLDFDLCFQDFDKELEEISVQYNKPYGALILIKHNEQFIGCAGIRKLNNGIAELKRMFIGPAERGTGLGKELMLYVLKKARELGYIYIRLDTMKSMKAAINIYKECGFHEIEAYCYNPSEDAVYMEKKL